MVDHKQTVVLLSGCRTSVPELEGDVALGRCNMQLSCINVLHFSFFPVTNAACVCTRLGLLPGCSGFTARCPPLVIWPLSLFLCLCLFPVAPLYFPSVTVLSHHPSVLFRVSGVTQKALLLESCSLVLSGTYSLTPLALFQSVSLCHLNCHQTHQHRSKQSENSLQQPRRQAGM